MLACCNDSSTREHSLVVFFFSLGPQTASCEDCVWKVSLIRLYTKIQRVLKTQITSGVLGNVISSYSEFKTCRSVNNKALWLNISQIFSKSSRKGIWHIKKQLILFFILLVLEQKYKKDWINFNKIVRNFIKIGLSSSWGNFMSHALPAKLPTGEVFCKIMSH